MSADFWGLKSAGGTATAYHLLAAVLSKNPSIKVQGCRSSACPQAPQDRLRPGAAAPPTGTACLPAQHDAAQGAEALPAPQVTFLGVTKKFTVCQEAKTVNSKAGIVFDCLEPHHFVPEVVETYPYEQLSHAVLSWVHENAEACDVVHGHEWGGSFVDLITAQHFRQAGTPPSRRRCVSAGCCAHGLAGSGSQCTRGVCGSQAGGDAQVKPGLRVAVEPHGGHFWSTQGQIQRPMDITSLRIDNQVLLQGWACCPAGRAQHGAVQPGSLICLGQALEAHLLRESGPASALLHLHMSQQLRAPVRPSASIATGTHGQPAERLGDQPHQLHERLPAPARLEAARADGHHPQRHP